MTDKDIKKALECCVSDKYTCSDCPYEDTKHIIGEEYEIMPNGKSYDAWSCDEWLKLDLFDLINRLQAENERLTIRLRKVEHQLDDAMKMYNIIKAEAYKEFAERLKAYKVDMYSNDEVCYSVISISPEELDNLLKEMGGESDGNCP